jgi:hypothetical protein
MDEPLRLPATDTRTSRTIRRVMLAVGLWLIIAIGFVVVNQVSNEVTVINLTPSSMTIDALHIGVEVDETKSADTNDGLLLKEQVLSPQEKIRRTFRGCPSAHIKASIRSTKDEIWSISGGTLPSWGNRVFVEIPKNQMTILKMGRTTFRVWVDSNQKWLPIPASLLE